MYEPLLTFSGIQKMANPPLLGKVVPLCHNYLFYNKSTTERALYALPENTSYFQYVVFYFGSASNKNLTII